MEDDALKADVTDDPIVEAVNPEEGETVEATEDATAESEDEVVIEESDSHAGKPRSGGGYNKIIRRLKASKEQTKEASDALQAERDKNRVLEMALDQTREAEANVLPDPTQYDDGVNDPRYIEAVNDHTDKRVEQVLRKHTANSPAPAAGNADLERKQNAHAERAEKLNIANYAAVQDKAIDVLGTKLANGIVELSDKSEVILYHLGKNPEKAENLRDLAEQSLAMAVKEIGRLEADLKVKPKVKTPPPDPDTVVTGGTPSAGQTNLHQKRVDAAREKAQETGDMGVVIAAKKAAREAGVPIV